MAKQNTKIVVAEVGPRDGLQSFPRWVSTEDKVSIINLLSDAGFRIIEVTSFAHPEVVPMLADAEAVLERIKRRPGATYRALVPNKKGAIRAVDSGLVDEILGPALRFDASSHGSGEYCAVGSADDVLIRPLSLA